MQEGHDGQEEEEEEQKGEEDEKITRSGESSSTTKSNKEQNDDDNDDYSEPEDGVVDTTAHDSQHDAAMSGKNDDDDPNHPNHHTHTQYVILFYKYHPLTSDESVLQGYKVALDTLCRRLGLYGRILIGASETSEGINGTLAGTRRANVRAFTRALLPIQPLSPLAAAAGGGDDDLNDNDEDHDDVIENKELRQHAVDEFKAQSRAFFQRIGQDELVMDSPDDFKWSVHVVAASSKQQQQKEDGKNVSDDVHQQQQQQQQQQPQLLFPDLNIKIVKELIGTGGVLASIPIEQTGHGYLTPAEWHEHLTRIQQQQEHNSDNSSSSSSNDNDCNDVVLIDCRNTKEYDIGHFVNAINPQTTTYSQFTQWVKDVATSPLLFNSGGSSGDNGSCGGDHGSSIGGDHGSSGDQKKQKKKKTVYMYCTGGIRCEKASAFIRQTVPNIDQVYHLKGGIHKYLEEFGSGSRINNNADDINNQNDNAALWQGRNFVFDGRLAASPEETQRGRNGGSATAAGAGRDSAGVPTWTGATADIPTNTSTTASAVVVVGRCLYCQGAHDTFEPHTVCTVCREPVLVCNDCCNGKNNNNKRETQVAAILTEFHCRNHFHLRHCYFTNLNRFSSLQDLQEQFDALQDALQEIAVGRRFKQQRKTIVKQMQRVMNRIQELQQQSSSNTEKTDDFGSGDDKERPPNRQCRNCSDMACPGNCWGFFGLKRKEMLEKRHQKKHQKNIDNSSSSHDDDNGDSSLSNKSTNHGTIHSFHQPQQQQEHLTKKLRLQDGGSTCFKKQVDDDDDEVVRLGYLVPPSTFRDAATGIRVPPCVTRTLTCRTKAKWCGRNILQMIQHEFVELAQPETLQQVLQHGLLRLNHNNISSSNNDDIQQPRLSASNVARIKLKSSDTVSRVIHWHEAPVLVPETIPVQAVQLDLCVMKDYGITSTDDAMVYVCDKPSSVPVHPAGPYLANSLTVMMEGQLGLSPRSLKPIHRTDRVTSGLTLCCTSAMTSRAFHKSLTHKAVDKLYLAKVHGKFPSSADDVAGQVKKDDGIASWDDHVNAVLVDAPIFTSDPANGLRTVSTKGKPSLSLFQRLSYNEESKTSLLACCPLTGRNHQLRVHLQWLGFSILDDVQYGGQQTMATNDGRSSHSAAIDLMRKASIASSSFSPSSSLVNADLAAAAKMACRCCSDSAGPRACFTAAQLLEQGHMIHLHAWRYRVTLLQKRKNQPLSTVTFQVDPPAWAESDHHLCDVSWLSQMATFSKDEES